MAHDFQFDRDQSFGEWLHREIHEAVSFEDAAWAIERAHRVEERLQAGRARAERLVVEIPWLEEATAFAAPGRYGYSRNNNMPPNTEVDANGETPSLIKRAPPIVSVATPLNPQPSHRRRAQIKRWLGFRIGVGLVQLTWA